MKKKIIILVAAVILITAQFTNLQSQTLYVPSGSVGTSQNNNVGIGIGQTLPGNKLTVTEATTVAPTLPALGVNGGTLGVFSDGAKYGFIGGSLGSGNSFLQVQRIDGSAVAYDLLLQPTAGKVGIGTLTPQTNLEVVGFGQIIRNTSALAYTTLRLYNNLNNPFRALEIDYSGSSYSGNLITGGPTGEGASITTTGAFPLILGTANTARMTVLGNGYVGIGTTTPQNKLHISEASQTEFYGTNDGSPTSNLILQGTASGRAVGQGPSLTFSFPANTDGSNTWAQARIMATPDNAGNTDARGRLYLQVRDLYDPGVGGSWNWRTGLMIAANGNVGIGTTQPTNKLDVNGTIHTKEVKVDLTGWSDFVFAPTYQLRPLSEVEKYVKANSHLPEIPSAAEVAQNGLSLGEMQNKLLQKVEELTLYSIEQDKKIQEQDKKNAELQQQIDELKTLIKKK